MYQQPLRLRIRLSWSLFRFLRFDQLHDPDHLHVPWRVSPRSLAPLLSPGQRPCYFRICITSIVGTVSSQPYSSPDIYDAPDDYANFNEIKVPSFVENLIEEHAAGNINDHNRTKLHTQHRGEASNGLLSDRAAHGRGSYERMAESWVSRLSDEDARRVSGLRSPSFFD